ncbi:MAG: DUF554 family protein [Bacteroidales bacterium]|nr:DUF554 family protein [Bacteroidales bacterium]
MPFIHCYKDSKTQKKTKLRHTEFIPDFCGSMTGTIINAGAVIVGSLVGLIINRRLNPRFTHTVFQAIGLFTLFLGISMALKTDHLLLLIFSLVLGALTGELMRIDQLIRTFQHVPETKSSNRITTGFRRVLSPLFCYFVWAQ